ncbi:uncharacterized protein L969DRAFT_19552 [Mixia osmundae IAM 14324]|uniref:V-type proton ATPase subunit n=1 Tax=Mixia osmundae (strain CBS 9802 / IAM 14324 / JCM 22182 / KY 12970) TaxID=764103 RepID=G7EAV4_MIXOS|nr:uncharacterized protein L969DRAFT_19552 [Mixia osmundae IAM 14324]KEI36998.1 hypothetical protein L969DRAFT_19552 [Mixia osmundae IAM 14324]GAA99964.1 hypothetical protein E5Q_06667 [Mixia osmundae IAM 14324]
MSGLTIVIVGAIAAGLAFAGFTFTPKGPNHEVTRVSIVMLIVCFYLMWSITYLAQLHPLIEPKHSGVRNLDDDAGAR